MAEKVRHALVWSPLFLASEVVVRILIWWGVSFLVVGTLKGYDQLMNLVLDDVKELLRGSASANP